MLDVLRRPFDFVLRSAPANVLWAMAGVFAILVTAELVLIVLRAWRPQWNLEEVRLRVRSWWFMAGVFALALLLSRTVSIAFFCFLSFLALKEYLSLIPTRRVDRGVLLWAYLAIPVQYLWVWMGWYGMFIIFIPVYAFLFLPVAMVLRGETSGFLRAAGTLHWGVMTMVFCLSHIAYLLVVTAKPAVEGAPQVTGGPALVFFLVFLVQFNDVAQYLWGKSFGRHKVVPTVSPNKTWEGLLGGVATTVTLAVLLAPYLTPLDRREAVLAGLILGLGGFLGDITISALKRDLGIKDAGSMLPGHGGILDRVNSLMFTAPLFFHFVYYLHF